MFITSTCGRKPRLLADDRYLFVFLTEKLPILYFLRELFSNQSVRILYIRFTVRREVANLRDFLSLVGLYLFITLIAPEFDFGNIFSDESLFETLNNCIPPTFIIGIKVIAMTIIPIPPSH